MPPIRCSPSPRTRCTAWRANIERYDADGDCIVTKHGKRIPVGEFADQVEQFADGGYLFQTRLAPHPDIAKVVGDQISTVRMFVLVDDQGPTLLRAAWKIPSGESVADNFWRSGNMLGGLDVETGVIRVLRRSQEQAVDASKTATSFKELVFPHWDEMRTS
jgi:hypothetical protein